MTSSVTIRSAAVDDASLLLDIYRPYVDGTAISFELNAPGEAEFAARIVSALANWAWLVAEVGGQPIGYAYGTAHRARKAYAHSVETSVYISRNFHRGGIGHALYSELFAQLRERGYANAFAGITLPNEASVRFHEGFGFESIGVFPRVGYKLEEWHDVAWYYRPI